MVEIQFLQLRNRAPFDDDEVRLEYLRRVNEIPGVTISPDKITKGPRIPLSVLAANQGAPDQLKRALEWVEERAMEG